MTNIILSGGSDTRLWSISQRPHQSLFTIDYE